MSEPAHFDTASNTALPVAKSEAAASEEIPPMGRSSWIEGWKKLGAGALFFSVLLHLLVFLAAGMLVFSAGSSSQRGADFLPGGGGGQGNQASQDVAHKVQQKRRNVLVKSVPLKRVVSLSDADLSLPDAPPDLMDLSKFDAMKGGGRGKGGSGSGSGKGAGAGDRDGMSFKPVMMFGMELKSTRKVAVVMDVSRSMTGYLPAVAAEMDKLAFHSVLVLYCGCGMGLPLRPPNSEVHPARGTKFSDFWQRWQGGQQSKATGGKKFSAKDLEMFFAERPMRSPVEQVYRRLTDRPDTFFVNEDSMGHAQVALLSEELADADTIYWFADFQDPIHDFTLSYVLGEFIRRKQRLYIHAASRGQYFEKVRDRLVQPLGGAVIEVPVEYARPAK